MVRFNDKWGFEGLGDIWVLSHIVTFESELRVSLWVIIDKVFHVVLMVLDRLVRVNQGYP